MSGGEDWPAGLQDCVDRWLHAQPQQHAALTFVDARRHPGHIALAALEQEVLDAAYGAREPQVVASKLQWWVTELSGASTSGGRHPLTRVLFADPRAQAISVATWTAPVLGAMARLEQGTAADFSAQYAAARPLHGALATLETAWWYGAGASAGRATHVAILSHLLHALRRLPQEANRDCLPLPMARLAQQGLSREQLRRPSAERTRAIKAQLHDLLSGWRDAASLPGPLSVFRAVESRSGRKLAQRAMAADDGLAALAAEPARPSLLATLQAWRAARAWLRVEPDASIRSGKGTVGSG